tara:strand:+ start:40 stop:633 length:594 start_codon:yes stop_codon:yes gene_type:complete
MLESYQTKLNCKFFADLILEKETKLLKKYPATTVRGETNFDGSTQLGSNSLTSRASHYNLLDWKESKNLIKTIKKNYVDFTRNKDPIYVHSWANVMRKGEQIKKHHHGIFPYTFDHLSGHLGVMIDDDTATYYKMENHILKEKNKEGRMTLFSSPYIHWTSQYNGNNTRITIAFDIKTYWQWKVDIIKIAKPLWKKI